MVEMLTRERCAELARTYHNATTAAAAVGCSRHSIYRAFARYNISFAQPQQSYRGTYTTSSSPFLPDNSCRKTTRSPRLCE